MAGDWIKMRCNLWDDPRVAQLCDLTSRGEAEIIGGLYWLWTSADQHSEDGIMPGLSAKSIDRKTGIKGFAAALIEVSWLADHPEGVRIVRFEEHNGRSAKRRCSESVRKMSARDADNVRTESGNDAEEAQQSCAPREEKRREEVNLNPLSANADMSGKPSALPDVSPLDPGKPKNGNHYNPLAREVLGFLNAKTGRSYQPVEANLKLIVARLKEGASVADCRAVVAKKCREWCNDEKMSDYLRPATLFNATKFAQYRGELVEVGDG